MAPGWGGFVAGGRERWGALDVCFLGHRARFLLLLSFFCVLFSKGLIIPFFHIFRELSSGGRRQSTVSGIAPAFWLATDGSAPASFRTFAGALLLSSHHPPLVSHHHGRLPGSSPTPVRFGQRHGMAALLWASPTPGRPGGDGRGGGGFLP